MANFWTFKNGQTGELEEHDLGSATLMEFLATNPSLGPVRRGKKETPEAKFTYGGDRPSSYTPPALAEEADPWSTSATTENPVPEGYWVAPDGSLVETAQHRAARLREENAAKQQATQDEKRQKNWLENRRKQLEEDPMSGFANRDAFAPQRNLTQQELAEMGNQFFSEEMGGAGYQSGTGEVQSPVEGQVKQYGEYQPQDAEALFERNQNFDTERTGDAYNEAVTSFQEVIDTLPPETQAKAGLFLQGMSGPLFDENGNPIFPEPPMDFLADLLKIPELAVSIGPLIEGLLDSRSAVIQNATSNRAAVEEAQAQFNPFGRTAETDRSLQAMLAGKQIEQTQAQFNPFGLTNRQGVQAIQDQFNPYAQDADARQALAETQFDPYGQDADARTDLISAQFNPYDYNQTQGLQAITRQYNPYGFSQAQGLEGISRQFNPYGETAADRLALQNPFGRSALQDEQLQTALARGGLSAEQRLSEIQASNNPMNTQNFLSFLGNPSAVGSAVSLGGQGFLNQLGGGQGLPQQSPQMMSPQQAPPAPSPAPTGSADFSYGAMKPYDPTAPASTQADFQDKTAEEIGFYEGSAAAKGVTPSALGRRTARVTPGGVSMGRGRI